MEVRWTRRARTRVAEAQDYIAKSSPSRANSWARDLFSHTELQLVNFPLSGRIALNFESADIRELVHKNYRIFYEVTDHVYILTIHRTSELVDPSEILPR